MKKIFILAFIIVLTTGCFNKEIDINASVNNNEYILNEQNIDNIKFSDTSLIYEKGISTFKVKVTNNGNIGKIEKLIVIFKNKNDSEITRLYAEYVEIEKGNSISLTLTSDIDLSDAYKVEYEIK